MSEINSITNPPVEENTPFSVQDIANGGVPVAKEAELEPEQLVISVKCTDAKGIFYEGAFVLNPFKTGDILEIGKRKVAITGGKAISLFQVEDIGIINAIATCTWMFRPNIADRAKDPAPHWFYNTDSNELPLNLFFQLYDQLEAHTDRYFRGDGGTGEKEKVRGYVEINRPGG